MISHRKIAIVFVSIFVSMILMKPFHFIFTDHSHYCAESSCSSQQELSDQHHDCSICLFSFFNFTLQKFGNIRQLITVYVTTLIISDRVIFLPQLISDISTRGPPAYISSYTN
ncbi:MAG TPA: hypothetical protein PKC55_02725 [Dysgonomonas sp.]|nr:hypothetical protein [Dysgonomonas sp.]